MKWFKKKEFFWEERFQQLAEYNSEVGRGIVHTEKYDEIMAKMQKEYNEKKQKWIKKNDISLL